VAPVFGGVVAAVLVSSSFAPPHPAISMPVTARSGSERRASTARA
jgi:hypothetical protein